MNRHPFAHSAPAWLGHLGKHPSSTLLAVQVLGVLVWPLMAKQPSFQLMWTVFGVLVLGLALRVVRRSTLAQGVALVLAVAIVALSVWQTLGGGHGGAVVLYLMEAAFYAYAALALIRYMLKDDVATRDELVACAATFTVLAWAFANLFMAHQLMEPGAYTGAVDPQGPRSWYDMLFLAFTTLSGVGLGDILPMSPMARALVMLAEFGGVMYIALVVSRLVGLTLTRAGSRGQGQG